MKKLIAMLLACMMLFGLLACTANTPAAETPAEAEGPAAEAPTADAATESTEDIVLEWYYFGNGVQEDTEKVEAAFNELLHTYDGMEHVSVNLNPYPGSELVQAVTLAQAGGQQIDLLNTFRLNFMQEVENGTFIPLNDYLSKSESLQAELPSWLWELGSVNGELYIIPTYQRPANMDFFITPTAWLEKYGDAEEMATTLKSGDVDAIAELLESYLLAVRAGEGENHYLPSLGYYYSRGEGFKWQYDTLVNNFILQAGSDTVENLFLTDDIVRAYEITAEWYEKGYIRPDVINMDYVAYSDLGHAGMMSDGANVGGFDNQGSIESASAYFSQAYGFDVTTFPLADSYYIANSWGAGGTGVTAACKHPDEAFRLIELLNTEEGKDLYNMVVYGIEGDHYERIDDTHIRTLDYDDTEGTGGTARYSARRWIMGNTNNILINQATDENSAQIAEAIGNDPTTRTSNHVGLVITTADIENELQQITAVEDEFVWVLQHGAMGKDWETFYNEFREKLNAAGYEKVVQNLQAQVDAFMASK